MLLLAFDTATPAVTVAVHDGDRVLAQATTVDARRQGELLASHIEKVLAQAGASPADLTAIVAGAGPGPYTGLRTGLVTARVLGAALGVAVHGVCTLDVIAADAAAAAAGRPFLVATDARRREVYWARYSPAGERLSGPGVAAPASLPAGCPPRVRARPPTPACSASRSSPASRRRPRWQGWRPGGWPRGRSFSRRNRSTSAGPTPGCPARPRTC